MAGAQAEGTIVQALKHGAFQMPPEMPPMPSVVTTASCRVNAYNPALPQVLYPIVYNREWRHREVK